MSPTPAFLSFGFGEMLVVGFVALMVFGGRLPEVMRNLGRAYARFRQGMNDLSRPIRDEMRSLDTPPVPRPSPPPSPLPTPRPGPPDPIYATPDVPDAEAAPNTAAPSKTSPPDVAPQETAPEAPTSRPAPPRPTRGAADEPPPV